MGALKFVYIGEIREVIVRFDNHVRQAKVLESPINRLTIYHFQAVIFVHLCNTAHVCSVYDVSALRMIDYVGVAGTAVMGNMERYHSERTHFKRYPLRFPYHLLAADDFKMLCGFVIGVNRYAVLEKPLISL